jgi:hypothetical protein
MAKKQKTFFSRLSNDQKAILLASGVVAVFLGGLVYFKQASFRYTPTTSQSTVNKAEQEQYEKLLAAIKPNKQASDQLFKELITEEEVRVEIEEALGAGQKVVMPQVSNADIRISRVTGKEAVATYMKNVAPLLSEFNKQTIPVAQGSFQDSVTVAEVGAAVARSEVYLTSLKNLQVPQDAVNFHKSQLLIMESYKRLLQVAKEYREGENQKPWPEVYKQYVIANAQVINIDKEFSLLDGKYNIKNVSVVPSPSMHKRAVALFGIKKADAALGIGDTVIVAANIPDAIKEGVKQGFASAYGKFATKYLGQLIETVEKNYKISNFLYYSDALVKGQYVNDYLQKYVSNPVDQEIIKRFIPQFACGAQDNQQLKTFFKGKAQEYLGFDPNSMSVTDPDFEVKMARVGEFLASDTGWNIYYAEQARAAQSAAEQAVSRELSSSGLKSPRDLVGKQIEASLNVIENSQVAALIAGLQLGSVNAENLISQLVASVIDQLINKFVFKGVTFKEQATCSAVPVETPIIPAEAVIYNLNPTEAQLRGNP